MKTTNIFKTLALAVTASAMMLFSSCGTDDDIIENAPQTTPAAETVAQKGYALPVTVNVTRQDGGTKATYNESTKKLEFSAGDKLFVIGSATAAGQFAGTLDYDTEKGNFSGTIYTQKEWTGTPDALFTAASEEENLTATLLPNGYQSTGFLSIDNKSTTEAYDDRLTVSGSYAFVASETAKATGVEQLSWEQAINNYSSGFALIPGNAILNFTITGLETGAKNVSLRIRNGFYYDVSGSVTPNGSGVATFAIGVPVGANIEDTENNLTVGSHNFTLPSSKTFTAGKIYNITRGTGGTVDLSTINANYTANNGEILTGTLASNVKISIADGATVTLNNVTINGVYDGDNYQWAGISCAGDATIILSGTNNVKGFHRYYPGIHVPTGKTLTIDGTGSLNASSNGTGSGIGGGWAISYGNIAIEGGTITATGGQYAAGIGGEGGNITISGGTVTAYGGGTAAGIGSGNDEDCGNIIISGGTVTAYGGKYSAGIGGGFNGSKCGNITITSGVTRVTATKGESAPCSIGKGADSNKSSTCGTVTIDGMVYADGITTSTYTYEP